MRMVSKGDSGLLEWGLKPALGNGAAMPVLSGSFLADALLARAIFPATALTPVTIAAAAPVVATCGTLFPRARLVHGQCPALKIFLMASSDGIVGFLFAGHFHKAKPAGFSGEAVLDNVYRKHGPCGRKKVLQIVFGGSVIDVPDE